jgi:superfamily I DNA/RNA helicase
MYSSTGLYACAVFIPGLEAAIFPCEMRCRYTGMRKRSRVLFVSITRA